MSFTLANFLIFLFLLVISVIYGIWAYRVRVVSKRRYDGLISVSALTGFGAVVFFISWMFVWASQP